MTAGRRNSVKLAGRRATARNLNRAILSNLSSSSTSITPQAAVVASDYEQSPSPAPNTSPSSLQPPVSSSLPSSNAMHNPECVDVVKITLPSRDDIALLPSTPEQFTENIRYELRDGVWFRSDELDARKHLLQTVSRLFKVADVYDCTPGRVVLHQLHRQPVARMMMKNGPNYLQLMVVMMMATTTTVGFVKLMTVGWRWE